MHILITYDGFPHIKGEETEAEKLSFTPRSCKHPAEFTVKLMPSLGAPG